MRIRHALVLDTNVYIMDVAGRLPEAVRALPKRSLVLHCSVCLGELAVGVAKLDPGDRRTASIRDHYAAMVEREPDQAVPGGPRWSIERPMAGETPSEASSFVRRLRRPHER